MDKKLLIIEINVKFININTYLQKFAKNKCIKASIE